MRRLSNSLAVLVGIAMVLAVPLYSRAQDASPAPSPSPWPLLKAHGMRGVWLSPDWILPGNRTYSEAEVRTIARVTMAGLKANGINTVFVETLMRGTSIAAGGGPALPVFPYLRWDYGHRGTRILDALQIFIDEANAQGIAVHAWVHLFYWRMDNDNVYQPYERAPSMWDDLLAKYLSEQSAALRDDPDAAALYPAITEIVPTLKDGVDAARMSAILRGHGIDSHGHPLGCIVRDLMARKRPAPDFLLTGSAADPFPCTPGRDLSPLYLNPDDAVVRDRLVGAIAALSHSHPDLAGIHLDHIRYPLDAQGVPADWDPRGRESVYFSDANPVLAKRKQRYRALVAQRDATLHDLVDRIRGALFPPQMLSAAVLPLYYAERGGDAELVNGYDYSGQDWFRWNVDFVVPMMYGFDSWRIRTLIRRYETEARAARDGKDPPDVVPGVSVLNQAQTGALETDHWIFFDLSLGLNMQVHRVPDDDNAFIPKK